MTTPNEELMARAKRLRNELDDSNARLDRQCVTAMYEMEQALQSQAERIAELDSLAANAIVAAADSQKAYMKLLDENFALRAELAAIDAIAICRRNAQNTSADELEALKGK